MYTFFNILVDQSRISFLHIEIFCYIENVDSFFKPGFRILWSYSDTALIIRQGNFII